LVRRRSLPCALVAAGVLALCATAAAEPPPSVDARAVFVQDGTTGAVLFTSHARERVPIASITKLMTVLLTLQHAKLDDVVVVPPGAAAIGESTIDLHAGDRLTVRELLEGALIQSANDAAWTLASYVGHGSVPRFVEMMNAKARALGLRDTHYVRPDGLDAPGHVSSARDVTRLARIVMRFSAVREFVRMRTASISGGRTLSTWNDLLGTYPGVIGVKTGHTSQAGWNEVAADRSRGVTLYATILGSPSRYQRDIDLERLLTWARGEYRYVAVISRGETYGTTSAGFGRGSVRLVAPRSVFRAVRVTEPLVQRALVSRTASLPVERGERLGEVALYQHGHLLGRSPLVAARSVSRPDLATRVGWYVRKSVENVWSWVT
jgi:serine-type D-Ala-D-Ala carboxypeptidase (penicillin-binding protein 5/6)